MFDNSGKTLIFPPKIVTLMRILGSILFCSSLLLSLSGYAQISIGFKGGPDFSRLTNAVKGADASGNIATQSTGTVTQYYGGIFVDIPLDSGSHKLFYIRPAVEFVGAGGSTNPNGDYYNSNGFTPSTKYTLQYVDVPVEFVFSPGFDWGRPYVGLGLYTGELVSGTIKTAGSPSQSVKIGNGPNDQFQRVDFGYTWSIGLATKVGFLFGVDYQHGLIRALSSGMVDGNQPTLQTRNSIWQLNVGWVFKL